MTNTHAHTDVYDLLQKIPQCGVLPVWEIREENGWPDEKTRSGQSLFPKTKESVKNQDLHVAD